MKNRALAIAASIALLAGSLAHADAPGQFRTVSDTMTASEYMAAQKHNKRVMRDRARSAVVDSLMFVGVPHGVAETSVDITGAAVGAYVDGIKVNITEGVSVRAKDINSDDPRFSLRVTLSW